MMPSSSETTPSAGYVFDNADERATGARFTALPQLYDSSTTLHVERLGIQPGWACLEVGAGGGSIARWLAERVGPSGRVLATDIDTRFLARYNEPPLEIRQHDITSDPLPEGAFDLVHTRLLLGHLPARDTALNRMVAALKPGGWLLVEEFDALSLPPDAKINPVEQTLGLDQAMREVMTARGVDLRLGRLLPGRFRTHGLVDVDAEGRVLLWPGGSTGSLLMRANLEQLREPIVAGSGISESEFDEKLARFDDPDIINPSPIMWSVWGRRP